jgi:hypothetical protein
MVDANLDALGYKPLPSLVAHPFLAGKAATKAAIMTALQEMVSVTSGQDYGIIYYVGHGAIAPSNIDLTLAVADHPVAPDDGIRVSDILGVLQFGSWRSDITMIPHYLIVLDACFSGNAALPGQTSLLTQNNVQRLAQIQQTVVAPSVAIMAATSDGDQSSAYELKGTNSSAFGYYFARALKEDFACADSITPDGILTLNELNVYLTNRLKLASNAHATAALMTPTILNKDQNAFIAYDPSKHAINGLREEIVQLVIQPQTPSQTAVVTLPSGNTVTCATQAGCAVSISRDRTGEISVASADLSVSYKPDYYDPSKSSVAIAEGNPQPPPVDTHAYNPVQTGEVTLSQLLLTKQQLVAGVSLTIK